MVRAYQVENTANSAVLKPDFFLQNYKLIKGLHVIKIYGVSQIYNLFPYGRKICGFTFLYINLVVGDIVKLIFAGWIVVKNIGQGSCLV